MAEPDPRTDATPDSALDSWPSHVAMAVATGLITTYLPVQRWRRPARWALHGGMAVAAGGTMALVLRPPDKLRREGEPREPLDPLPTAVLATGIAALVLGASRGGQAADEWAERKLAARGVRRPRVWIGAAAAVASLASSASDKRRGAPTTTHSQSEPV
jgi:peptidoglycan/LPS O-acetylase OafA/YrhL